MNTRVAILCLWLCTNCALATPQDNPALKTPETFPRFAPVEPADVAATFVVQEGFEMQLIAAEPLITDPVAMVMDEFGRAYVVEMNDYPYTDAKTHKAWADNTSDAPIGRIRLLEDTDNDGAFDRSTVFADGLSWPSGIACWRGGVFVTATPDVWYLKDTDGDKMADVREQVFTGFRKYNVQAVMNNPIWGLDNKLYVAGSSNGGSVVAPGETQQKPITARGDFRFDPRTRQLELQAGGARFGNCFDDWGNRFLCNIRNPAIHVVLDNKYLARNPNFAAPAATHNIAEAGDQMPVYRISPIEPWRELRGRQWSADPTKKVPKSELTGGGVFTSTSGITVYRGGAYPENYTGQLFVAEVANNVIYRQTVVEEGNTFRAARADKDVEFVASKDTWFRPVNLYNAPDGTLFVLDMYREFIEHPWSIPDDIHARLDLRSGSDRGRIYRLAPKFFQAKGFEKLGDLTSEDLVAKLKSYNSWQRETAQRLLVERQDTSIVPQLEDLLTRENPRACVHALWTLEGLGALTTEHLVKATAGAKPQVWKQIIQLAEPRLGKDDRLLRVVMANANNLVPKVRLQATLTLGNIDNDECIRRLAYTAWLDSEDPWQRAALCSASPSVVFKVLERLVDKPPNALRNGKAVLDSLMQTVAASNDRKAVASLLMKARNPAADAVEPRLDDLLWRSLLQFAKRKGISLREYFGPTDELGLDAESLIRSADADLTDRISSLEAREAALAKLTLCQPDVGIAKLSEFATRTAYTNLAIAAWQAAGTYKSSAVAETMIAQLATMTPQVREEALSLLMARPDRTLALLDAIEKQKFPASLMGLPRQTQLLASTNAQVKARAEQILGKVDAARGAVVKKYLDSMPEKGDAARGQELFASTVQIAIALAAWASKLVPTWKQCATGTEKNC